MGKTCEACGKQNHFQAVCRSKNKHFDSVHADENTMPLADDHWIENVVHEEVHEDVHVHDDAKENVHNDVHVHDDAKHDVHSDVHADNVPTYFFGSVHDDGEDEKPWRVSLDVAGRNVSFKIDTGADVSVISESQWKSLCPKPKLSPTKAKLLSPGGPIQSLGQFIAKTQWKKNEISFRVFVLKGSTDNLLSRGAALKLGLVQRLDDVHDDLVFGDIGKPVDCAPVKITLRDDAEPYSISVPRRVPIPLLPKVEKELQRMEEEGVIEKITEATDWCAPIVPVLKKNGSVRICVDLKRLNRAVRRERYTLPTLDDVTHKLAGAKVFSKLDAASGFWQIPLDPSTAKLTTFLTPFGRYYFKRLPFGISLAPEVFQRTMEQILGSMDGVVCFMDDVVVCGDTAEEHDKRLEEVLKRVSKAGLKLNKDKCEFRKEKLEYLGHQISGDGMSPDPSKLQAILDMPEPEDVTATRRFIGMVNYLGRFVPNLATVLRPLNALLHKDAAWLWGPEQQAAFSQVKKLLTQPPTLAFYDVKRETVVCSDASSYGLGGVLYQLYDGELKPVAFCSRTLTPAETKYAQIEKELLAAVYACEKFERYLIGLPVVNLRTDHKPLIPMINKRDLTETPVRCQRMLMRLMRHNVLAEYTPGKNLVVADALSRAPRVVTSDAQSELLENDVKVHVDSVKASWGCSDQLQEKMRVETEKDVILSAAVKYTREGWPQYKEDVILAARELYGVKDELSVCDGLLIRGKRIVVPFSLRKQILDRIHDGHQGIVKCRERANQGVWWPGISREIKDLVSKCKHCIENSPEQRKEPLIPSKLPDFAFQKVGVDLCEKKGKMYLVLIDYYSRYIEYEQLSMTTSSAVICELKKMMARYGIPEVLYSDNGSQFSSKEFSDFVKDWGIVHITSSPKFPQSNGEAENAVKTVKKILTQQDPSLALLTYRATPIPSFGKSPAELALSRNLRTRLPVQQQSLLPQSPQSHSEFREKEKKAKEQQKKCYDQRHGVQPLSPLKPGDSVRIRNKQGWKMSGKIVKQCAPRSYEVQTPTGMLRRNRSQLRPVSNDPSCPVRDAGTPVRVAGTCPNSPTSLNGADPFIKTTASGRVVKTPQRYR
jgi:transposase InsO family protein